MHVLEQWIDQGLFIPETPCSVFVGPKCWEFTLGLNGWYPSPQLLAIQRYTVPFISPAVGFIFGVEHHGRSLLLDWKEEQRYDWRICDVAAGGWRLMVAVILV
ncbi:hypothetical protein L3X38_043076 [Prunus dulcis]|uniref:Uncharacterized protein n=1 Tax=Prunus dulcis TaxID=3755 RepID=A0AAD4YLX0_PRUDU|nr:hypothetical protein L3X38_043076 [Prunus dulcis]